MKPTRTTQPLRAASARPQNPALKAAQRGRAPMLSPADIRRAAMKKRNRKRYRGKAGKSTPLEQILGLRQRVQ